MKKVKVLFVTICASLLMLGMVGSANAIPCLQIDSSTTVLLSGAQTSNSQILTVINAYFATNNISATELYKSNAGGNEEKTLADSYDTEYGSVDGDPYETATISYVGGNYVGQPAYLLVKDGNSPSSGIAWYFYDLTALGWNGTECISIAELWPGNGAISHVSLFGTEQTTVPEPTSLLLLGFSVLGLAGVSRRLRKK